MADEYEIFLREKRQRQTLDEAAIRADERKRIRRAVRREFELPSPAIRQSEAKVRVLGILKRRDERARKEAGS